ncbi:MAG: hypothetical protein U0S12_01380 [Fimbriimonadales bacterium]
MVEALMAVVLTGVGVAGALNGISSMTHARARMTEKEAMLRLAHEKFEELESTGEYLTVTNGDFQDRGETRYAWSTSTETTGVDNLTRLTVTVTLSDETHRSASESVTGLLFEEPQATTGGAGTTP